MSPDWSDSPEPVPYADLTNPQTLNLYGYVKNNPLSTTDPDGHCCLGDDGGIDPEQIGEAIIDALHSVNYVAGAVKALTFGAYKPTNDAQQEGYNDASQIAIQAPAFVMLVGGEPGRAPEIEPDPAPAPGVKAPETEPLKPPSGPENADNGSGIPKPPTGKGSVAPGQRDPKRTWARTERQKQLDQQDKKCARCGENKTVEETNGHHKERHADGGRTNKPNHAEVCKKCHKDLHRK
jgi:HNH endonuclease